MSSVSESIDFSMSQAGQPPNEAEPSGRAKRGAKPKACDTCRPLKTKCAPREGTCGRCERLQINCVRSHVGPQQPPDSAASGSSSQQSLEADDHSAEPFGADTNPQQSQEEANLTVDPTDAQTISNHQEQMDISSDETDAGAVPLDSQGEAVSSIDPTYSEAFFRPPQEETDQSFEPFGHETISQQSREGFVEAFEYASSWTMPQHTPEGTDRSFRSVGRGSSSPLSHQDMNTSSDMDDSETDSEQSHVEAPRTPISVGPLLDLRYKTTPVHSLQYERIIQIRVSSGTFVRIEYHKATSFLTSAMPKVREGYAAAVKDERNAILYERQFTDRLQEIGYRIRRREIGNIIRRKESMLKMDEYKLLFKDQDAPPALASYLEYCKRRPAVPEQVWICIKSESFIPVGTVLETLPEQVQESQLEQVMLEELTGPELQHIITGLWEKYGSSI